MPRFVNPTPALAALAAASAWLAPAAVLADGARGAAASCDPQPWSYGAVMDRKRPGGVHRIGPQRFCVEIVEERRVPLGPIGIVIDPFAERPSAPPVPAPHVRPRAPWGPAPSWR